METNVIWNDFKSNHKISNQIQIKSHVFQNQIIILQIKSLCVIQSWFKSNYDLDLPIIVTFTMKLPWFLLNLVWIWSTVIQLNAVKQWTVVWPCPMQIQQRKRASRHWRHCSMTSFFIVVHFTHEMAYLLPISGGYWGIWPPKCGRPSCRPQKGSSLRDWA